MADSFAGQASGNVALTYTPGSGFLSGQQLAIQAFCKAVFQQAGVLADQFDKVHAKQYAFSASGVLTMNLASLADILGATFSLAGPGKVRIFAARINSTTDADKVTLTPSASNGWAALFGTGGLIIQPSTANNHGFFLAVAPNTAGYVVDSTHRSIDMTPASANSFTMDVLVAGCTS